MESIRRALILGLARNPLPETSGDALTTVALVAARGRYARSAPPREKPDPPIADSDQTILVPDKARSLLIRLFTGKDASATDGIAFACVTALRQAGLRLHPFDYSRLEDFVARFANDLGVQERQWLNIVRPEGRQEEEPYSDAPVTEETVAKASKTRKLSFLKAVRRSDAARARSLIEGLMPGEPANMRAELAGLLGAGLSNDDRHFLEGLAADRAQSVRDTAEMLLARLPDTAAYYRKLERARDMIEIKTRGLVKKTVTLSLRIETRPNVTHTDPVVHGTVFNAELFHGLLLADLASALQMPVADMLAASANQLGLGHLMLRSAALEGAAVDLDRFASLFSNAPEPSALFVLKDVMPATSGKMRAALLELALSPEPWGVLPSPSFFEQVFDLLREPLPHDMAARLMASSVWRAALESGNEASRPLWVENIAPLVPRSLSPEFIRTAEPYSRRAVLFHSFLLSLPEPK
jgi:hypothetical protein